MVNILLVGASGHAKVVIDIVEQRGEHRILGLLNREGSLDARALGYAVLGRPSDVPVLAARHGADGVLVAIGDNADRARVTDAIRAACPALTVVSAIHPKAVVGRDVRIGEGTVIMAGATINPCCTIGRGCIVNTHASLDHDSVMEEFANLSPGVVTGGNCRIGAHAVLGIGAVLIQGIQIGAHAVIGAGATVLDNIEPHHVAFGTPARPVRRTYPDPR